jgi:hypothetical protein
MGSESFRSQDSMEATVSMAVPPEAMDESQHMSKKELTKQASERIRNGERSLSPSIPRLLLLYNGGTFWSLSWLLRSVVVCRQSLFCDFFTECLVKHSSIGEVRR